MEEQLVHPKILDSALEEIQKRLETNNGILPKDLKQEDIDTLYQLGFGLYQSGEYERAESVFRKIVVAKPLSLKYWKSFASSLQLAKKHEEALLPWSMLCIFDDTEPSYHMRAAECLFSLGNRKKALSALESAKLRTKKEDKEILTEIDFLTNRWQEDN